MTERTTNVCMVVMSDYPNDGRVRREAEALARAGITVDIFCLRGPQESRREEFGSITAYRILRERGKEGLGSYLVLSALFTVLATVRLLGRSARKRYDLIQAHSMPDFLVFCGLFHKLLGRPVVLDLHDLSVELFASRWSGRKAALFGPVVTLVERLSCRFSSHLITTSPGFEERLVERGNSPDDMTMVLNTAESRMFAPDAERQFLPLERDARLLYHGTVAERFGLLTAIDALAIVRREVPGSTLRIFGKYDPSYEAVMLQRIEELGLEDAVTLDGWKPLEEIRRIIADSDIGVVPYLRTDFMELALSTKTFEYAASGLPVVASELAPVTAFFDSDSVALVEPGDADDMAREIVELCRDPHRRCAMTKRASAAIEGVSGDVMAERYVDLVRSLTGRAA